MLSSLPTSWRERAGIAALVVASVLPPALSIARAMRPHPPA